MAWRFKASKYKNAAPLFPKKEEVISDLPVSSLLQSCGNHIKASCAFMAFNIDSSNGGNLAYLPLSASGRQGANIPIIHAHSDFVSDFDFSPFDDSLLATGSLDRSIKLWRLQEESLTSAHASLPSQENKIENILWHSTAEGILAASAGTTVKIFDVIQEEEKYNLQGHEDQVQSISWKADGSLLATSCRDKKNRIFDPRAQTVIQEGNGHPNVKDSRIIWLGDSNMLLSTGFGRSIQRQVCLWDCRNITSCLKSTDIEGSTGTVMPFFDEDTNMVFLVGKSDTSLRFWELTEKDPYLTESSVDRTEQQIKGAATIPKRVLNVMDGEVDRLLLLVKNAVISTPYIVPRKTYRDFHEDLFPDTFSGHPALQADEWFSGENKQVTKISLDPAKKGTISAQSQRPSVEPETTRTAVDSQPDNKSQKPHETKTEHISTENVQVPNQTNSETVESSDVISQNATDDQKRELRHNESPLRIYTGIRQSKFKYLKGTTLHKSKHIDNIRNLASNIPGESDMFYANKDRCVLPLTGSGGILAILEFSKPGRLPETGAPIIQNGSGVVDYAWDPFDNHRLAVACDDAKIRIWKIPQNGVTGTLTEPEMYLKGHMEKIYFVKFHPLAKDILVTGSYDQTIRLWDLSDGTEKIKLVSQSEHVFCISWSPDGKYCATVSRDSKIRIYNPRMSAEPLMEGAATEGSRGARVVWVLDGNFLVVSGFDKSSGRQLKMYSLDDLSVHVCTEQIDVSPSILVPYYDEDSSTLFLSGRGDSIIFTLEVCEESPYLFPLSFYKPEGLHQALSFLPKNECDVRSVEFAKAHRLTNTSIEPISFTVPRVKDQYFQDDLFPDTKVTWEPTMSSSEWLSGTNKKPRKINLQPKDMTPVSAAPTEAPKAKKYDSFDPNTFKTDEEKREELVGAMMNKFTVHEGPMEQDAFEGVDEDEWDD